MKKNFQTIESKCMADLESQYYLDWIWTITQQQGK